MKTCLLLGWILLAGVMAAQPIVLDREKLDIVAQPETGVAAGFIRFTNRGATAVTVREIRTDCDFITARTDQAVYAPGISGTLEIRMKIGRRRGEFSQTVTLSTDDGTVRRYVVNVHVTIPNEFTIDRHRIEWVTNEPATAKIVHLTASPGHKLYVLGCISHQPGFTTRVQEITAGSEYAIEVTPLSTTAERNAGIGIVVQVDSSFNRQVIIIAAVNSNSTSLSHLP